MIVQVEHVEQARHMLRLDSEADYDLGRDKEEAQRQREVGLMNEIINAARKEGVPEIDISGYADHPEYANVVAKIEDASQQK